MKDPEYIEGLKQKILSGIQELNESGRLPYYLSVSCGIGCSRECETDHLKDVLQAADSLMYEEKKREMPG